MKLVTWNVNGLRACMNKGFKESMEKLDADIISIQETKMQREQASFDFPGYYEYWNSAVKKGYSGTAIFSRMASTASRISSRFFSAIKLNPPRYILRARRR